MAEISKRGTGSGSDELRALYRASALGALRDRDEIINEILQSIEDLLACERALLFLYDEERDGVHMHTLSGQSGFVSFDSPCIVRRIFHSRSGEVINDTLSDIDVDLIPSTKIEARQAVVTPVTAGERVLGVIAAINSTRGAFTDGDLLAESILADKAALVLENATLVATIERQAQELQGLVRLSRLVTSSESMRHVVGEALRVVGDLLACERIAILLHDETTNDLVIELPVVGSVGESIESFRVPLSEPSLVSTVFRTNTALISNEAASDPWVGASLRTLGDLQSILVAPLTSGSRPIGALIAMNRETGSFEDTDLRFISLLSARVASVIEAGRARERERALMQSLREADRTKTEFVSMLAHELKGPMTTILGFSLSLQNTKDMDEDKRVQILGIISKEVERLSRLVNDLLDVSRMDAGTLRYEMAPVSVQELIENILTVHPSLTAKHIITPKVDEDLPKVLGDKDRLRQVLINLLTNATHYSPDNTEVVISASWSGGDKVEIEVSDQGIGVPSEDRERIFMKFAMLPKPGWVKKGTGLGLFITKGIIEAQGGQIWVDSETGKGSTFHVTLPVATDRAGVSSRR